MRNSPKRRSRPSMFQRSGAELRSLLLEGIRAPGALVGEDTIKKIEALDALPESYFRELTEARVRAPAIKDIYNGDADVDAFEWMCSSVYHHLKLTAVRTTAVR